MIALITSRVDIGLLVHSVLRQGGFPEHETIIEAVRERLAQRPDFEP